MKKVAIIGTVGIPASYGGFETLVENIVGDNQSKNISYTVYCSSKAYTEKKDYYKGARLKYIPLNANGPQSILYDIISLIQASHDCDEILVLGVSGCCFLPVFRLFSKKRLIINIDGLEHRRGKWGKWTKKFLRLSELSAIKYGDEIIVDNKGIEDYVNENYGKPSKLIAYGGDHVLRNISADTSNTILRKYHLESNKYAFSVCRIEPENNVHLILEAFSIITLPIVFVGNWNKSEYGKSLFEKYSKLKNIILLSPIYDLDELFVMRSNCFVYMHGHSAGGTNPSLVEAMFFGKPIIAFDCVYNRYTTDGKAIFFSTSNDITKSINDLKDDNIAANCYGKTMSEIATQKYLWKIIADKYEQLY